MSTPIPLNRAVFSFQQIALACNGKLSEQGSTHEVQGIAIDSRAVTHGNLFVAIPGERFDGHSFIDAAVKAGAVCVLVENGRSVPPGITKIEVKDTLLALGDLAKVYRSRFQGTVVAVTGSVGKTTTKELIARALSACDKRVLSTSGNLNNLVGVPMTLFTLSSDYDSAVLELGSSAPGEIARLSEIVAPQVGVVTAVAVAHTEQLSTIDKVAAEKSALLLSLPPSGVSIYNADADTLCPWLSNLATNRRLSFGFRDRVDVRLLSYYIDKELISHCRISISFLDRLMDVELRLLGKGAALDATAAMTVVLAVQGPDCLLTACRGLKDLAPVSGRLRPVHGLKNSLLLDDSYNSNPESAKVSLETAVQVAKTLRGRAVAILGDMAELGIYREDEHEKLGHAVVKLGFEVAIFCGEMMIVGEQAAKRAALELGSKRNISIHYADDPKKAISLATEMIQERDIVLIKGSRCMEMERVVQELKQNSGVAR